MPFDPASRYDPTSMGRIADDDIDPEAELFDHADNRANNNSGGFNVDMSYVRKKSRGRAEGLLARLDVGLVKGALCGVFGVTLLAVGSVGIARAMGGGGGGGGGGGVEGASSSASGSGAAAGVPPVPSPTAGGGSGGGGGAGAKSKVAQFVPPPDNLSIKCAPLTVSVQSGWDECQRLCASAECCFLPEGHWYSCASDHEEDCSAYEYGCKTLDHVGALMGKKTTSFPSGKGGGGGATSQAEETSVTVPAAPQHLADMCAVENFANVDGHKACKDACDMAGCCDDDACEASNPDACEAYRTPCLALGGNPATHPDAVASQAKVKCNTQALMTTGGVRECSEFCDAHNYATCCLGRCDEDTADDCAGKKCRDSEEWCAQFGPCQGLVSLASKQGGGVDGDDDPSNYAEAPPAPFDDSASAKSAVDEACGTDYKRCVHICGPAECCFNGGGESGEAFFGSCPSAGLGDIDCGHYNSCAILFTTTVVSEETGKAEQVRVGKAPSNLADLCASKGDEADDCDAYCRDSHCCAESNANCVVMNGEVCADYVGPCEGRWADMAEDVSVPAEDPTNLARMCADLGNQECQDACKSALCCSPSDECVVRDPSECHAYVGVCQPLWDAFRLESGPAESLKDTCDADGGSTSEACLDGCREAVCCSQAFGCDLALKNKMACGDYANAGCEDAWESLADKLP